MNKKEQIRLIEVHLKNYKTYLVGRKNIQESLDEILPNITTNCLGQEDADSSIGKVVLDRVTGLRAVYLGEIFNNYNTIINSITDAVNALNDDEKEFIKYRYFEGRSIEKTAQQLGYSEQNCFKIRIQALDKLLISLMNLLRVTVEI